MRPVGSPRGRGSPAQLRAAALGRGAVTALLPPRLRSAARSAELRSPTAAEPTAHARADRGTEPTARARSERGAHLGHWAHRRLGALRSGSLHSRSRGRGTAARHPAHGDVVHGKHRPRSGPVRGLPKATASRLVPALAGPGWADALAICASTRALTALRGVVA